MGCSGKSIRNEDAIYLMYLVCKELKFNRQKIISDLTKTIEAVLSIEDIAETNTTASAVKMEETKKKRTGLIELYTSGDIDKDEFTALRAKYDGEIETLKAMADSIEKQQEMIDKQRKLLDNIKIVIEELMGGVLYEDVYYTQLLDKMVVWDKDHIDVYLNMLPFQWQFALNMRHF